MPTAHRGDTLLFWDHKCRDEHLRRLVQEDPGFCSMIARLTFQQFTKTPWLNI